MPPKGKSKNAGKGKGRGRGRPVLRAPFPSAVSDSPEHTGQDTEKDPAAQKLSQTQQRSMIHRMKACLKPKTLKAPGQRNASSPSQFSVSSQKSTMKKPKKSCRITDEQDKYARERKIRTSLTMIEMVLWGILQPNYIQSNFNGSNTFGTMENCSSHG